MRQKCSRTIWLLETFETFLDIIMQKCTFFFLSLRDTSQYQYISLRAWKVGYIGDFKEQTTRPKCSLNYLKTNLHPYHTVTKLCISLWVSYCRWKWKTAPHKYIYTTEGIKFMAYLSMSLHNGHQLTRALYTQFHNLTIEPANQPWSQSTTILHISLWFSHILSVSSSTSCAGKSSQSIPLTTCRDANNAMLQSAAFRTAFMHPWL